MAQINAYKMHLFAKLLVEKVQINLEILIFEIAGRLSIKWREKTAFEFTIFDIILEFLHNLTPLL